MPHRRLFEPAPVAGRVVPALAILLIIVAVTALSICNLLFGCGCEPLWGARADHCDVTVAGAPDCSFCAGTLARRVTLRASTALVVIGIVIASARRTRAGVAALVLAGVVAFLSTTAAAGAIVAALDGNDRFPAFLRQLPPPQHPAAR